MGNVDFNRTWQEYVEGFGPIGGDHWLGLKHVQEITDNDRNYALIFILITPSGEIDYPKYNDFKMGGSAEGYRFSINPNVVDRKSDDCLSPPQGAPFSTYDNDVDGSTLVNCAQRYGAGWWYIGEDCSPVCSPLSLLSSASDLWSGSFKDAFWSTDSGNVSISKIEAYFI